MLACSHSSRKCFYDSVMYFLNAIYVNVGKRTCFDGLSMSGFKRLDPETSMP